ncbi:recombinase family protein [Dermacoccus nishinomiyaensis]
MSGQIVGYVRVSSSSQNFARQLEALGAVDELFEDRQSGKTRTQRPGLEEALRYVRRGDTLRVASMDRLARSLIDLEQIVSELTTPERGVSVEFVKERLTFSPGQSADPFATFQRQLIGAVAELERSLIRERQREGIDLAKARGVYKGRTRRLTDEQVAQVREAAAAGESKAKLAVDLGVSRRLIYDVLASNGAYAGTAE